MKVSKELTDFYEICGVFLIIIGMSNYTPFLFYLWEYLGFFESNLPGSINLPREKPPMPHILSIWFTVLFVATGIAMIYFGKSLKKLNS